MIIKFDHTLSGYPQTTEARILREYVNNCIVDRKNNFFAILDTLLKKVVKKKRLDLLWQSQMQFLGAQKGSNIGKMKFFWM